MENLVWYFKTNLMLPRCNKRLGGIFGSHTWSCSYIKHSFTHFWCFFLIFFFNSNTARNNWFKNEFHSFAVRILNFALKINPNPTLKPMVTPCTGRAQPSSSAPPTSWSTCCRSSQSSRTFNRCTFVGSCDNLKNRSDPRWALEPSTKDHLCFGSLHLDFGRVKPHAADPTQALELSTVVNLLTLKPNISCRT